MHDFEPIDISPPAPLVRVSLSGDVDTVPALATRLASLPAGVDVEVDLSRLRFLGSAGLGLLLQLRRQLADVGAWLYLTGASASVERLLVLVGLHPPHHSASAPARAPAPARPSGLPGVRWLTIDRGGLTAEPPSLDRQMEFRRSRPRRSPADGPGDARVSPEDREEGGDRAD